MDEEFDYWSTDTQAALLSGDYAINDRWTVFAAIPYVRKRFNSEVPWGGDPHNPNDPYWIDFVPPDKQFWDDGEYHGALQDFSIGVSYLVAKGPWTLRPYVSYGVPVSDYPFFAKAAIGLNLWTIPVGTSFSFVPYFSDWHFDGNVAYVFSEKPLGANVDYWLVHLSAGYWFKANLSVNAFLSLKYVRDGISLLSPDFIMKTLPFHQSTRTTSTPGSGGNMIVWSGVAISTSVSVSITPSVRSGNCREVHFRVSGLKSRMRSTSHSR